MREKIRQEKFWLLSLVYTADQGMPDTSLELDVMRWKSAIGKEPRMEVRTLRFQFFCIYASN